MNRSLLAALAVVAPIAISSSALSAVYTFDAGINQQPWADVTIIDGFANQATSGFITVRGGDKDARGLVRVDVSSIPSSMTDVISASLEYRDTSWFNVGGATGLPSLTIDVYEVLQPWSETQVTWTNRVTGVAWSTAGGDLGASPVASFVVTKDADFNTIDLSGAAAKALIAQWIADPSTNHGLALVPVVPVGTTARTQVNFNDEDSADAAVRPSLTINAVPEPATLSLMGLSGLALLRRRR